MTATVNGKTKPKASPPPALVVLAVLAVVILASLLLTRPAAKDRALSPLSGLMALKASVHQAVPYQQAMASPQPALIEFYADWCTTCQAMAPTLAGLQQRFGDRVNFVMLDIDDPRWAAQVQQFGVTGVPHLALVQGNSPPLDQWIGKVPEPVLVRRLQDLLVPG